MSSGYYAVRDINRLEQVLSGNEGYYYKECAIKARNPLNEADSIEKQFLVELNKNQQLTVQSGVRIFEGKPYFYMLRRGEAMEEPCMRCHSTPEKAPDGIAEQYGSERSFSRKVGETASALSIRIPLEHAYVEANEIALRISLVLIISIACMFLLLYMLLRHHIFIPLSLMKRKTEDICEHEQSLGIDIPVQFGTELNDLVVTFNTMSHRVKDQMDKLEERVKERTSELEKALAKVSTLHGMLPICSSCKKIRDDKGYWSQVETYISEHTEAVFTSGICPECEKAMYAKLEQLKNENS
jgi:methyl-accepting chemotaxis protein